MSQEESVVKSDQVHVGRHFKLTSEFGTITMNRSAGALGIFVSSKRHKSPHGDICVGLQNGSLPYISVWPSHNARWPWAFSAEGLQYVRSNGDVRVIPLAKLAEVLDKIE